MVARLKLKEIDGRAPPGVKDGTYGTGAGSALLLTARPLGVGGSLDSSLVSSEATYPNCGDLRSRYRTWPPRPAR